MSRTDFEAAYIERYGHRPRGWNDDFQVYQDAHANGAWFGWQARAAGIEAKAAPVGEREVFAREGRYTVIKHKDLAGLPRELLFELRLVLDRLSKFTPPREYVVVESDWPEYEPVWQMIENRAASSAQKIEGVRANEK